MGENVTLLEFLIRQAVQSTVARLELGNDRFALFFASSIWGMLSHNMRPDLVLRAYFEVRGFDDGKLKSPIYKVNPHCFDLIALHWRFTFAVTEVAREGKVDYKPLDSYGLRDAIWQAFEDSVTDATVADLGARGDPELAVAP